mmetsp:Transcript_763/g.1029  ORF Transcript_763/g.1029 Transcript_763/m.1029 type:complete len:217 (+) Transcript_763:66-716(+)
MLFIDPYLIVVKCFSTWLRLRILMGFTIVWLIILLGLSGYTFTSDGGSFASMSFKSGNSYSSWSNSICASSPYIYLRPFSFTSSGSTTASSCGFPASNSDVRFVVASVAVVHLIILFFKTPVSLFARPALAIYGCLFFSSCVMDSTSIAVGQASCDANFQNTYLGTDISNEGLDLTCTLSNYSGVAIVDFGISALFLVMHTAWGLTTDLYVSKGKK